ncbi:MAG: hypothetical protein C5B45_04445 [Chlamydiae bacterium]|nr:MAG: hypothetical protein C5B45_04445 [Chlamydiota bacterium]
MLGWQITLLEQNMRKTFLKSSKYGCFMPKKYIQLLLSINFCLTAVAIATGSDAGSDDSFVVVPNHDIDREDESESSIETELRKQFYHIWRHLEKINTIHSSKLLQRLITEHQQSINSPIQYDESKLQKDLTQDIFAQFARIYEALSKYEFKEELDENSYAVLDIQVTKIYKCMNKIRDLYVSKASLSKSDQLFLNYQLEELLIFSQNFLAEGSEASFNDLENSLADRRILHLIEREENSTFKPFADEESLTKIELGNQFNQIWDCLDEITTVYQSKLLQSLISYHKGAVIFYYETLEEVSLENLDNQFIQLHQDLETCSQYQPKEELDEDRKAKLAIQIDLIEHCLSTIHEIYDSKKESLSTKEKIFLRDQLEELHNFFHHFILENLLQEKNTGRVELGPLDKIQMLFNSCEEEDSLIYPQYEYIMNSQETNVSDLLTSSPTQSNTQNHFLYFNEAEGLIELQHTEVNEGIPELYTTTWRIRPADISLVRDWRENDSITIDKTSVFSQYTMRGERLKYTLNNSKKSVRANFVCKSSNQNTYTILSIDYFENIVVLKNGPCLLFVKGGNLKEWHVNDTVVLERTGPVTNTNNSHVLINKTRNKRNWVFLKLKW